MYICIISLKFRYNLYIKTSISRGVEIVTEKEDSMYHRMYFEAWVIINPTYLSLPEHLIFIGVLLAKVGKSCQDYCKDLGNDYACDTRMITNNRSEIFGINCDDSTTHAVYSESYHPSYNEELNRCEGFIGVPAKFDCNAQSPSNKKIARLCNCVSPCM